MASGKAYLNFILDQLAPLDQVTHRAMMGEYILYYRIMARCVIWPKGAN